MNFVLRAGLILFLLLPFCVKGQTDSLSTDTLVLPAKSSEKIFKPTLGLGTGMFSYFGDVTSPTYRHALVSRIGYQLEVGKDLTPFLELNFHAIFGKLGGNERSAERNLNFQSEIRAGGLSLIYNFHHLLPEKRNTEPWISVGVESFEFLSKTDLFDQYGNRYYYWSDGSVMNLPEDHPNAGEATYLQRDYTYESDIRTLNLDGYGKYAERSFSIPVGAGMRFRLSDRVRFKLGSTMHITFTDYVDGVSDEGQAGRVGDSRNDWFMMTSGSLSYDFEIKSKNKIGDQELPDNYFDDIDFLALETDDDDQDQVRDFDDLCAGTPVGVKVDQFGCPLDNDQDGAPDFRDVEPGTTAGVLATYEGEELTDSLIALRYDMYMDSTGKYGQVLVRKPEENTGPAGTRGGQVAYMVEVGRFSTGIPPELINKFLSIPDITTRSDQDSVTLYLAGRYSSFHNATRRMEELKAAGIEGVVVEERNGRIRPSSGQATAQNNTTTNNNSTGNQQNNQNNKQQNNPNNDQQNNQNNSQQNGNQTGQDNGNQVNNNGQQNNNNQTGTPEIKTFTDESFTASDPANTVVFRVQLGAFRRKLSRDIFTGATNLVEVTGEDGLTKYLSGSYTDYSKAATHKVDMLLKGFNGAFVVAYKNGKRISLTEAGATLAPKETLDPENMEAQDNMIDKSLLNFKVQVGAFRNDPPAEIQSKMDQLGNIEKEVSHAGLTRYTAGSFKTYDEAEAFRKRVTDQYGLEGAFIVSYFKGQIIPIQEALELLK